MQSNGRDLPNMVAICTGRYHTATGMVVNAHTDIYLRSWMSAQIKTFQTFLLSDLFSCAKEPTIARNFITKLNL